MKLSGSVEDPIQIFGGRLFIDLLYRDRGMSFLLSSTRSTTAIGESEGASKTRVPSGFEFFFNLMQFSGRNDQNNRLAPPSLVCLKNPGSATD